VFGDRDAGGVAHKIDIVEVGVMLGYDELVAAEKALGAKFNVRAFHDDARDWRETRT